jgi:hypothetical protein
MPAAFVDIIEKIAQRQLLHARNLFESPPEFVLYSDACLVTANPN